ncbi:MAG TPA: ABC transporter ATP-binding protein [Anaeromyxobacteraceae bacterium]|nr:ABC transporter ATP-binding protein [Anaeromyxobacteraceae bacterium]
MLEGVSLELAAGRFAAVVGPSGCGKTTLLRMVGGLERPDAGRVLLGGDARVSFCFQDARLLPWRSALDNVALPLELAGVARGERRERAHEALSRVQLGDRGGARPAELSGGMRMRVALARALVTRPALLLLDEPFGALDEVTRQELDDELLELWQASGMTALLVTHSIAEAAYLAGEVVVLSRGPGRVVLRRETALPVRGPDARATRAFQEHVVALQRALAAGAGRRA